MCNQKAIFNQIQQYAYNLNIKKFFFVENALYSNKRTEMRGRNPRLSLPQTNKFIIYRS